MPLLRALLLLLLVPTVQAQSPELQDGPPMRMPRAAHQVSALGSGHWLVSGGCSGAGCSPVERSAERFDVSTGRFSAVEPMAVARVGHFALALDKGQVLVAGGWTGQGTTASAERFDASRGRFEALPPMRQARMDASATRLDDGQVLVVGGASATNQPLASAERFDVAQGRWLPTGSMAQARAHHAAVKLADGRVLVTGGLRARNQGSASAELYDPGSGRFEALPALKQPRCKHAALRLPDGRVMLIGGSPDCNDRQRLRETEIYDPASSRFETGPRLQQGRYKIVDAVGLLADGSVLVAGDGPHPEIWRAGWTEFRPLKGDLAHALSFSQLTRLDGDRWLLSGGYDQDARPLAQTWLIQGAAR